MSNVGEYLEVEEKIVSETREMLARWYLDELLNDALALHRTLVRAYSHQSDSADDAVHRAAEHLGLSVNDLFELVAAFKLALDDGEDPVVSAGYLALAAQFRREAWGMLLALNDKLCRWSVGDIHRRRLSAVLGYERIQAEVAGLVSVIASNAEVAWRWMRVKTDHEGRAFHRDYGEAVSDALGRYELSKPYNLGSGVALHPRFATVAMSGLTTSVERRPSGEVHSRRISADEFDAERPRLFIAHVLHWLRVQAQVVKMSAEECPVVTDPVLLEQRIPRFQRDVGEQFARYQRSFPKELAAARKQYGDAD